MSDIHPSIPISEIVWSWSQHQLQRVRQNQYRSAMVSRFVFFSLSQRPYAKGHAGSPSHATGTGAYPFCPEPLKYSCRHLSAALTKVSSVHRQANMPIWVLYTQVDEPGVPNRVPPLYQLFFPLGPILCPPLSTLWGFRVSLGRICRSYIIIYPSATTYQANRSGSDNCDLCCHASSKQGIGEMENIIRCQAVKLHVMRFVCHSWTLCS